MQSLPIRRETNEMRRMPTDLRPAKDTAEWMDHQLGVTMLPVCVVRELKEEVP